MSVSLIDRHVKYMNLLLTGQNSIRYCYFRINTWFFISRNVL